MAIKADRWIRKMALEHGMIEPFEDRQVRQGVVSYGVSSYGYDCRVGNEFKVFTNVYNTVVDPKNFDPKSFVDIKGESRSSTSRATNASCRRTRLRWPRRWSISASRAMS
jgi:deoxycytidine triphosphate deaminase